MGDGPRTSPLLDAHRALGARMTEFAGWSAPLSYRGTLHEHLAVRASVGVFDVSHLGVLRVEGADALGVVDRAFTNDPRRLGDGDGQYTLCCAEDGGVLDDLLVFRLDAMRWLAVPNAANTAVVRSRLREALPAGRGSTTVRDEGGSSAVLAVQGPEAFGVTRIALARFDAGHVVDGLAYLGVREVPLRGSSTPLVVCRSGYTGERGMELIVPAPIASTVWDDLVGAGAEPCGLGARDTLRLEMGYPLHGHELVPARRPDASGVGWAVRPDGRDFIGAAALRSAPPAVERLVGLETMSRRAARAGQSVLADDRVVGTVTSGSFAPSLGHGIGLAVVDVDVAEGDHVDVDVRGERVPHVVRRPPFVTRDPR